MGLARPENTDAMQVKALMNIRVSCRISQGNRFSVDPRTTTGSRRREKMSPLLAQTHD